MTLNQFLNLFELKVHLSLIVLENYLKNSTFSFRILTVKYLSFSQTCMGLLFLYL
jgi:hypothetical protein